MCFMSFYLIILFTYDCFVSLTPATSCPVPQLHQEEVARWQWAGEPHRWCFLPRALTCRQLLPIQRVAQWDGRRYPLYRLTPPSPINQSSPSPKYLTDPFIWLCLSSALPASALPLSLGDVDTNLHQKPPNLPPFTFTALETQLVLVETSEDSQEENLMYMLIVRCLKTMITYNLFTKKLYDWHSCNMLCYMLLYHWALFVAILCKDTLTES